MTSRTPAYYFSQLRRALKRYREGRIDAETLAAAVERFLAWDAEQIR